MYPFIPDGFLYHNFPSLIHTGSGIAPDHEKGNPPVRRGALGCVPTENFLLVVAHHCAATSSAMGAK